MEKKKVNYALGTYARRLLLMAFPMIILQLLTFIAYIAPMEGAELIQSQMMIYAIFDAIGRGIVFTAGGTLILDYMEKKHEKRNS